MKSGEIVKVYQDPVTCSIFEDEAELIELVLEYEDEIMERWIVKFSDSEPYLERWINKEIH